MATAAAAGSHLYRKSLNWSSQGRLRAPRDSSGRESTHLCSSKPQENGVVSDLKVWKRLRFEPTGTGTGRTRVWGTRSASSSKKHHLFRLFFLRLSGNKLIRYCNYCLHGFLNTVKNDCLTLHSKEKQPCFSSSFLLWLPVHRAHQRISSGTVSSLRRQHIASLK